MKLIILVLILHISPIILSPSSDMWNKLNQHIKENKTLIFSGHFIFDEENYTALDVNADEMKQLYNLQDTIYKDYHTATYIFAIKNLDTSLESLDNFVDKTRDNLRYNKYDVNNSFFAVILIEQNDGQFYIGKEVINIYINTYAARIIKSDLLNNIKNKNYYNGWKEYLESLNDTFGVNKALNNISLIDILDLFKNITVNTTTSPNEPFIFYGRSSSSVNAGKIVLVIVSILIGIGLISVIVLLLNKCAKCCVSNCCKGIAYLIIKNKGGSASNSSKIVRTTANNSYYDNNYYNNNDNNYRISNNNSYGGYSIGGNTGGGASVGGNIAHNVRV